MDYPRSPPLNWCYYYQGKSMEEVKQSLLCTILELETTRLAPLEEIREREEQVTQLKNLLNRAIWERDDAQDKCQILFQQLQQQNQNQATPNSGVSSIDDDAIVLSSSDCEESIVSVSTRPYGSAAHLAPEKPLPEKGKLLEAVIRAGPLLQTLLLAGPLPQWRHPPPPLESFHIPPVGIPSPPGLNKKRRLKA